MNQRRTTSDERCDERRATSGVIVDRRARLSDAHRSSIAPLADQRAMRSSGWSHRAIDDRCSPIWALSSLTLSLIWALSFLSLSLSLSFRKWIEVKMRVENHFRVKGENFGQQEAIFWKMKFTVAAKRLGLGENDFRKYFYTNQTQPKLWKCEFEIND